MKLAIKIFLWVVIGLLSVGWILNALLEKDLKKKAGQMVLVGFRGTEATNSSEIYKIIKDIEIGGVILFDQDIPSGIFPRNIENPEQVKKLTSDLQKYSKIPLFVAIDEEGGSVQRLKEKYGFLPKLSAEKIGQDRTFKTAESESKKTAFELNSLGFNLNFAPVVDVNVNQNNPIISKLERSFSKDVAIVAENAGIFIKIFSGQNIISVAKHFPGHGSSAQDTHNGLADVSDTYKEEELEPYRILNERKMLHTVMTAHIINKKIDPDYPATLSKNFLQGILRDKIGFNGVIFSDDMQMGAISQNYGFEQAVVLAVNAGVDVVVVSNNTSEGYDADLAAKTRDAILKAVKRGEIKKQRIEESYARIIKLKKIN